MILGYNYSKNNLKQKVTAEKLVCLFKISTLKFILIQI